MSPSSLCSNVPSHCGPQGPHKITFNLPHSTHSLPSLLYFFFLLSIFILPSNTPFNCYFVYVLFLSPDHNICPWEQGFWSFILIAFFSSAWNLVGGQQRKRKLYCCYISPLKSRPDSLFYINLSIKGVFFLIVKIQFQIKKL